MPLRKEIREGIRFILSIQNPDGGIPVNKPNDLSGPWTTAEAVETLIIAPYTPKNELNRIREMVEFILSTQIVNGRNTSDEIDSNLDSSNTDLTKSGYWPFTVKGSRASTMATGHCVAALALAENIFDNDEQLRSRINQSKSLGINWLREHQNHNGGWGVEPEAGSEGQESRTVSTVYALRGFIRSDYTSENSKIVRDGVNYLYNAVNEDGGWGYKQNVGSDPSNTARAVRTLIRSGEYNPNQTIITEGIKYITTSKPSDGLWETERESYMVDDSTGHTVYHSNTPYDVLEAYLLAGYRGEEVDETIRWFLNNQEDDGRWYFGTTDYKDEDISTWTTNGAIYVLDMACDKYLRYTFEEFSEDNDSNIWQWLSILFSVTALTLLLHILGITNKISQLWMTLPPRIRDIITVGIFLTLVVNLISNYLSEKLFSDYLNGNDD